MQAKMHAPGSSCICGHFQPLPIARVKATDLTSAPRHRCVGLETVPYTMRASCPMRPVRPMRPMRPSCPGMVPCAPCAPDGAMRPMRPVRPMRPSCPDMVPCAPCAPFAPCAPRAQGWCHAPHAPRSPHAPLVPRYGAMRPMCPVRPMRPSCPGMVTCAKQGVRRWCMHVRHPLDARDSVASGGCQASGGI
eukprot:366183-Chlamydomonas_euryale.AAC.6